MKKNVMMRVASALLVAVLMTTCAISGTFAKYTTTVTANDDARVAYWGFGTSTLTIDMFDATYNSGKINANTVGGEQDNIVGPGASKTCTIQLKPADGVKTPEVAYKMTFAIETVSATADLLAKLVWKLNGETVGTFADLQTEVAALEKTFAANTLPGVDSAITIGWEWPFEVNTDGNNSDTTLGQDGTASLEVKVSITVTQEQ